jgi:dihydrofolate reductase
MDIALIVAMSQNGIIGLNNQLPWRLPEDLRYFKKTTMGKPVIMGRKTFDSIGKALPGRTNIVITTQQNIQLPDGVRLAHSMSEAMKIAESVGIKDGVNEVMVIGGEQIYALFMPKAARIYLTKVHADVNGDAYFSSFNENDWQLISEDNLKASENNPYDYSFCVLERKL